SGIGLHEYVDGAWRPAADCGALFAGPVVRDDGIYFAAERVGFVKFDGTRLVSLPTDWMLWDLFGTAGALCGSGFDQSAHLVLTRWTGSAWDQVGGAFTGDPYAAADFEGRLVVGGNTLWGEGMSNWSVAAAWDGTAWADMPVAPGVQLWEVRS